MSKYHKDCWNPWTKKSSGVFFKSNTKGTGDGEEKLAKEFDTQPLGQNSLHDLVVDGEKWEVKKLDTDNSFRLGVSIAEEYNNLRSKIIGCFHSLDKIKDHLISELYKEKVFTALDEVNTAWGHAKTKILEGLYKDEVAESNINKLNDILESLKNIINFKHQVVKIHSSYDGKICEYTSLDAVRKINLEKISVDKKIEIFGSDELYDRNLICSQINEELTILKHQTFKQLLNDMVRGVFDKNDMKLVEVEEQSGYKIHTTTNKIYCYRITSGAPRCRVES